MSLIKELYKFKEKYRNNMFRVGLTLLDNSLSYAFNKNPVRGPLYIGWSITYKCCCRCVYCTAWEKGLHSKRKELTTDEALSIIKQAGKLKTCTLSFTGGEPLIRPDLFTLIKEAKKQGITVNLNTNGFFLKEKAKKIIESGVDSVTIGMDSHKPSIHNSIKRTKVFKLASDGIKELKKLRKDKKPTITIRGVITNKNYKELEKYIDYWKDKVDGISLQPIHVIKSSIHNIKKGKSKDIKIKQKEEFLTYFKNLQKKHKFLSNAYYNEIPTFLFDQEKLHKKFGCFAGYHFLKIDPYGDCFQCGLLIKRVGNLRLKSLKEIWLSDELKKWREIVRERKNKCGCWIQYGLLNAYLTKLLGWLPRKKAIYLNNKKI